MFLFVRKRQNDNYSGKSPFKKSRILGSSASVSRRAGQACSLLSNPT